MKTNRAIVPVHQGQPQQMFASMSERPGARRWISAMALLLAIAAAPLSQAQEGPRVVASSIQEGSVLPAGAVTYVVTFSEPMNPQNLDSSDFSLREVESGTEYTAAAATWDATATVLTVQYLGLPDGAYQLNLVSGDNRFESAAGLDLDGEPVAFPIPPNQSGDGVPGGDFFVKFSLDSATVAVPGFSSTPPLGSLIYRGSVSSSINPSGDTDRFTLVLDPDQSITVSVLASSTLQATIALTDPAGNTIGFATGAAQGQETLLQTVPVTRAGTYTITVGGAAGTTGRFRANMTLNAALENEAHGGPNNDTLATAQNLAASGVPLAGGNAKFSVVGSYSYREYSLVITRGASFEIEGNDVLASAQAVGAAGAVLGAIGNGAAASDSDWYRFSLSAGQTAHLFTSTPSDGPGEFLNQLNPGLDLFDPIGNLVAAGVPLADGRNEEIIFTATIAGTYSVQVTGEANSVGEYLLRGLGAGAAGSAAATSPAASLPADTVTDFYSFDLNAGQSATLALTSACGQNTLELRDGGGNVLATGTGSAQNVSASIQNFVAPASGTYYAAVTTVFENPSLAVSGYPSPAVVGENHTFTVSAVNSCGDTALGYTGTIHFISSDAAALLPADYTFTALDQGTHTFSAAFNTLGTQSLTVTDAANSDITGTQSDITVICSPPVIHCPGVLEPVRATSPNGASVEFSVTATSSCSVSVACDIAGTTITSPHTFPIGVTSVHCTATDASSNESSCTFSVTVKGAPEQINDLIARINGLPQVPNSTKNALIVKLKAALTALAKNDKATACARMKDFISLVQAQKGKKIISADLAAGLIADATLIRSVIGCL